MRASNIKLIIISLILVIANAWLFWLQPKGKSLDFDPEAYSVSDTTAIVRVSLAKGELINNLDKEKNWLLNDQYKTDQAFIKILMNVLNQFRLSRAVTGLQKDEILSRVDGGVKVKITGDNNVDFTILGNSNRTATFLIDANSQVFQIEIPGYADYIGSIFELTTDQWRNREIINGNWRSIQQLSIDYTDATKADLHIAFDKDFFKVGGIAALDSNRVVSYLNLFEHLQANERISKGSYSRYDSLVETQPFARLTIDDIYFGAPKSINFYPMIPGERIQLASDPNGEPVIFEPSRVRQLLVSPEDFKY